MADFKEAFRSWMQRTDDDEGDTESFYNDDSPSEPAEEQPQAEPAPQEEQPQKSAEVMDNTGDNVVSIHDDQKVHFVLFKPETFDKEVTTMADRFIARDTVILNMEQTNKDVAKRIIDFLGGVAYAHSGKISRVAEDTYIVMPSHVDISGDDLMDEVESDNVYF
jgi:cell division inhibitor SepF